MKIGMVTAVYRPVINGVTRMIGLYKQHLEAQGHEVTVFTLGDPDPAGEEPGVIRSPAFAVRSHGYYLSVRYSRQAQERLREMDVLHCHHLFMSVALAHRYAHCPIVYTNHTRYDLYTGAYSPLPQSAANAIMRQVWPEYTDLADVVVAPSESVRRVLVEFGVRRPIEVIPNGIDISPFLRPANPRSKMELGVPETAVLLIYVGRLSPEKNVRTLLEQFAIAHDVMPELRLMLVGKGVDEDDLRSLAEDLGIAAQVTFTGQLPYEALPNILAAADIFVTASVSEVHPLTIIEAMAAGLPVAGSRSPGIIDMVEDGKSGTLVAEPAQGLAAAIVALAANEQRRRRMGAAAREASKSYDIRVTVAKTLELYRWLRETRPDLEREREHGRWYRGRRRLFKPKLMQLTKSLRPAGEAWRWLTSDPPGSDER